MSFGSGMMQGLGGGLQGGLQAMMLKQLLAGRPGQSPQGVQPGQPQEPPNPYANANFANIVDGGYNPAQAEAAMDQALGKSSLPDSQRFPQAATMLPQEDVMSGLKQRLMGLFGGGM